MALRGLKPVVEIQFFDYIWPAYMQIRDELVTHAVALGQRVLVPGRDPRRLRRLHPRRRDLPLARRARAHSPRIPGSRVVCPATRSTRTGCSRTAIRCDDPVLFLEHKHLYRQTYNKGANPGPNYMIPFGKAVAACARAAI